jgi:hypothetical protein
MIVTFDRALALFVLTLFALSLATPVAAQTPLDSQHLAAWMGLEVGDELAYETSVTVRTPPYRACRGRGWPPTARS